MLPSCTKISRSPFHTYICVFLNMCKHFLMCKIFTPFLFHPTLNQTASFNSFGGRHTAFNGDLLLFFLLFLWGFTKFLTEWLMSKSTARVPIDCICTVGVLEPVCLAPLSNGNSAAQGSRPACYFDLLSSFHLVILCSSPSPLSSRFLVISVTLSQVYNPPTPCQVSK